METTLDSAEKNPIVDRTTVFGELKGITYTDIGDVVLDILGKYCDVSENLRLAIRLSKNALLRKKCEDVISQMVSYRIGVIESYGFSVQKSFLNFVNDMKPGYLLENLDFILHTIRPIASFECEDWSMTDTDTVTFRHGCLPPTAALAELRKQYFQLTKNLFQLVTTNANRRKVFDAMFCLADVPHSDLSIETVDLLSTDIANIIDFLIASIDNLSNVNKEDVQKLVYRIERLPFKNQFTNLTILNDRIAHDPFFEKFRIFYGDDLHFFPNFDFEKAESFRLSKIDEYVNVIDCGNFDDWRPLFEELLSSHKEFGGLLGGLMYFQIFLRKLGEQKPAVAFKFLNSVDLGPFLGAILSGLMESSAKEEARERLTSNSKRIETQLATAQVLLTKKDYDDSLFKELYPNLISTSDSQILTTLLQTIVLTYDKHRNHKGEFTEIIDKFTNLKFFSWSYVYFSGSKYYWQELTRDNIEAILRNLSNCENIGYEEESVLSVIGEKNPKEIVRFFEDRINLAVAKKLKTPIPFEFLVLNKTLAKFPEIVLPEVTAWLSDEDPLKKRLAGKLIENIFPSFGNSIEQFVLSLTRKKDAKSLDAVLRILEHYEGEPFVHNIVKEILLLHPIDEALRERLYHILSSTKGIIGGKYGFFDAYKLKKQQLIDWLNDSNTLIKEFTRGFIDYLDQLMDHEKNKVDKEVAFIKREFEMGQSK